jgi:hypothetical protein
MKSLARIGIVAIVLVTLFMAIQSKFTPNLPEGPSHNTTVEEEVPIVTEPDMSDLIVVESLTSGDTISSPLTITGKARGYWYFEATFPIVLTNWDGLIIAQGYATADGEWMTEDFVLFTATLEFEKPAYGDNGFLILQRDNPSGLPENDAAIEIPVKF